MKKFRLAAMLLFCALLAGCGNKEPETVVFYDIETEEEELTFVKEGRDSGLGIQFLQGEPVMLVERRLNSYGEQVAERDIYLCRTDGSRELLVQGAVGSIGDSDWYVDNEQAVYHVDGAVSDKSILVKYDPQGRETCRIDLGAKLVDILQMADGRIYLLLQKGRNTPTWLEELDAVSGKTVRAGGDLELDMGTGYLGAGPEGLFSMRGSESTQPVFMKVDLKEKREDTFLTSIGTSYTRRDLVRFQGISMQDFRVLEDGSVEILWGDKWNGRGVVLERLTKVQVEKIPLTVRASTFNGNYEEWLRQQASRFNSENEKYHVVLEEYGVEFSWDTVTREQNWEGYAEMTSIQMATGKGPDILYGNVLRGYAAGLAEKGGFEDLAPYMERSGIREEDYYPFTFSGWRDGEKIYSIRTDVEAREYVMDGAVLGTGREPGSIRELTDALLAWQGDEIFLERTNQAGLLELFLSGTEDIWGMVDWEQGTCDFGGELFGKLLEAAKRYGDDGSGKRAPLAVTNYVDHDLFGFVSSSDREKEGLVKAGVLFEDGCHAVVSDYYCMMMNANSANKEGAWEFICFLLGEEAQSVCNILLGRSPVYKAAFPDYLEQQRSRIAKYSSKTFWVSMPKWIDGERVQVKVVYGEEDLSDEEMGEYLATLEDARELPVRTRPIIEIICEEAGGYFAGSKSVEETAAIVKNRVQVYLDEVCSPK